MPLLPIFLDTFLAALSKLSAVRYFWYGVTFPESGTAQPALAGLQSSGNVFRHCLLGRKAARQGEVAGCAKHTTLACSRAAANYQSTGSTERGIRLSRLTHVGGLLSLSTHFSAVHQGSRYSPPVTISFKSPIA